MYAWIARDTERVWVGASKGTVSINVTLVVLARADSLLSPQIRIINKQCDVQRAALSCANLRESNHTVVSARSKSKAQ